MEPRVHLSDQAALRQFLETHTAATLAVPLDTHGLVHAASLLYRLDLESLRFYFVTSKASEKYTLLHSQPTMPAALVVGTEKDTPFTVQLRGTLQAVDPTSHIEIVDAYYQKRGNRHDDVADPNNSLLEFIPTWARFTDYAKGYKHFMLELT